MLKARLIQQAPASGPWRWFRRWHKPVWAAAASILGLLVMGWFAARTRWHRPEVSWRMDSTHLAGDLARSRPNTALTPGATILLSRSAVCSQANVKNKEVPASVQRIVFAEYGLAQAQPRAYEVDYLVTPALGGADDIRNLWPESSTSTVWNAQVKDALEDHLRDLVCSGQLDLATAQHEIAMDWIEAYKKYFHTDRPLNARIR